MYSLNKIISTISLLALVLGCFGLPPQARAVCQEGCDLSTANTFSGDDALILNTTGFLNTAIGINALYSNKAYENTANGALALSSNTTGFSNTATGRGALELNTTGYYNMANGAFALYSNTTGLSNTAVVFDALYSNPGGSNNPAIAANNADCRRESRPR